MKLVESYNKNGRSLKNPFPKICLNRARIKSVVIKFAVIASIEDQETYITENFGVIQNVASGIKQLPIDWFAYFK